MNYGCSHFKHNKRDIPLPQILRFILIGKNFFHWDYRNLKSTANAALTTQECLISHTRRFYMGAAYLFLNYNCILVYEMSFSDRWGHSKLTTSEW